MHATPPTPKIGSVSPHFAARPDLPDAPFSARPLTRSEQRRGDLYTFRSPKLDRPVEVIHRARLAMALELEFDPDVTVWVERPRLLAVNDTEIELCFWRRSVSGREGFHLFVDAATTTQDGTRRVRHHRQARDIIQAANDAGLSLEFVFEAALLERKSELTSWFRLLPYVQTAATLPHLAALERLVEDAFLAQARMSFLQLEQNLGSHAAADVRAVACRLIHLGALQLDLSRPLTRLSVLSKEVAR